MIILPAIDILNHKPVRLYKGDYNQVEAVSGSVLQVAKDFEAIGASFLHIVDLDGAKDGMLTNQDVIVEVAQTLRIPIEVGGGIRTMEAIAYYLDHGVQRVILGTSAMEDETLLKAALARYQDRIAVGVDCKDGYVYGHGWLAASELHYVEFAQYLATLGVKTIIVTDISKDGTLAGPNLEMLKTLQAAVTIDIIASGGIKDISHIKQLKQLGVYGAITGKAMYHKTLDLEAAILVGKE